MQGRVAVIVPSLNDGEVLDRCLITLQRARRLGHQVIVSDGGSTDGTQALAEPRVDAWVQGNAGRAAQMNRGAVRAEAEWLWFMHADTQFSQPLETYFSAIQNAGRDWGRFDVCFDAQDATFRLIARMMNVRSRLSGIATGDQGIFVRRELFVRMGGFAEIPLMEDIELCRRLKRHARPMCLSLPLQTSARRWQEYGVVSTVLLMWRLRLAYFLGASPQKLARQYPTCSSPAQRS